MWKKADSNKNLMNNHHTGQSVDSVECMSVVKRKFDSRNL